MARLVGVDLPRDKRIEVGLTYIYGIGLTTSKKILAETGINPDIAHERPHRRGSRQAARLHPEQHQGGGRPAPRGVSEHQAPYGNRLLPWPASSQGPARSRSAHPHECPYPQGSPQANRRQEEVSKGAKKWQLRKTCARASSAPSARTLPLALRISSLRSTTPSSASPILRAT